MKRYHALRWLTVLILCAAMLCIMPATVFASNDVYAKEGLTAQSKASEPSHPSHIVQIVVGEDGCTINANQATLGITYRDSESSIQGRRVSINLAQTYFELNRSVWNGGYNSGSVQNSLKESSHIFNISAISANNIARAFTGNYFSQPKEFTMAPYGVYTFYLKDRLPNSAVFDYVDIELKNADSLSIQSLRIIRVDNWAFAKDGKTLDQYFNGTLSSQLEGSWYGQLMAEGSGTCAGGKTTYLSPAYGNFEVYFENSGPNIDNKGSTNAVSMQFADTLSAGVETLLGGRTAMIIAEDDSNLSVASAVLKGHAYEVFADLYPYYKEFMTLEITYLDVLDDTRKVQVPFFTAYITHLIASNEDALKDWIIGIFQQADTAVVPLQLAQYKSLVGMQLIYGEAPASLATSNEYGVDTDRDTISIDSMCFYESISNKWLFNYNIDQQSFFATPVVSSHQYSYTSDSVNGVTLSAGHKLNVTIAGGTLVSGAPVKKPLEDTYVFALTNSSVAIAKTQSDIYMDITYMDTNGFEHTLREQSLKELVGQFYGYTSCWDSLVWKEHPERVKMGNGLKLDSNTLSYDTKLLMHNDDLFMQYYLHVKSEFFSGMTTQFAITLPNVDHFISVSFSIRPSAFDGGSVDEWQLAHIAVQKATSISVRTLYNNVFSTPVARIWTRSVTGEQVAYAHQNVLLQDQSPSQTVFLSYVDKDGHTVEPDQSIVENNEDYLDKIPSSMPYEDTLKLLGFAVPKYTYQVTVDVADVADAGSTNYFYFQLIFEHGTSAVVQANQQLQADGFRQGKQAAFLIRTTQNYGELKAVRIIYDNISSTSNVFDKLNISKISVNKLGGTGISRVWLIENVGWIDITYTDEGAGSSQIGSEVIIPAEKTNTQLVQDFTVTNITLAVDLQFCITTAKDSKMSLDKYEEYWTSATLVYLDSNGIRKEANFDLTALLQDFYNNEDLSWLYRPNKVDRFVLSLPDVSSIISLKISRSDGKDGDWAIAGISVQMVGGGGPIYMSQNNEYVKDFKTSTDLTNSDQIGTVTIGGSDSHVFNFKENTITVNETEDSSWDATISREPDTTNDTLNVYLYSGSVSSMPVPFNNKTAIEGAVMYTVRNGGVSQTSFDFKQYKDGDKVTVMYAEGISVNNMATLNSMYLEEKSGQETVVGYAIVERVRGAVIIDTYRINYGKDIRVLSRSYPTTEKVKPMKQKVTLLSAAGQTAIDLDPEAHDVAVALLYTSANALGDKKKTYQSPYIYLTDQAIGRLSSNQNIELEFNIGSIDQIVGISVISTGPVFRYDGVTIQNYDGQNGNLRNSYNATREFAVSSVQTIVSLSSGVNSTAAFSFTTAPNSTVANAGTSGRVSMTITYIDSDGKTQTWVVDDMISRLPAGASFSAGTTTQLNVLLPDAVSIEKVTLYADDNDWYLSAVGVILTQSNGVVDQKAVRINNWVKPRAPMEVDMNGEDNEVRSLTIFATSQSLGTTTSSDGASFTVNASIGDTITLTPEISYSGTPDTTLTWKLGQWKDYCTLRLDNRLTFKVPQDAKDNSLYQIEVSVASNPSIHVTIKIRVEQAPEDTTDTPQDTNQDTGNENKPA